MKCGMWDKKGCIVSSSIPRQLEMAIDN